MFLALQQFFTVNGRLPFPANPTITAGDTLYLKENSSNIYNAGQEVYACNVKSLFEDGNELYDHCYNNTIASEVCCINNGKKDDIGAVPAIQNEYVFLSMNAITNGVWSTECSGIVRPPAFTVYMWKRAEQKYNQNCSTNTANATCTSSPANYSCTTLDGKIVSGSCKRIYGGNELLWRIYTDMHSKDSVYRQNL